MYTYPLLSHKEKHDFLLDIGAFRQQTNKPNYFDSTVDQAQLGDLEAAHKASQFYFEGTDGQPKDISKAIYWLHKAANGGFAESQYMFGWHLINTENFLSHLDNDLQNNTITEDFVTNKGDITKTMVEKGESHKVTKQQVIDEIHKLKKSARKTFQEKRKKVKVTHTKARKDPLSLDYLLDPQNFDAIELPLNISNINPSNKFVEASRYLRNAGSSGHLDALVLLGNICMQQDPPFSRFAVTWYNKADSHSDAQYNLGQIYFNGSTDVDKDLSKSIQCFRKAADSNDASALFFLGHLYRVGCHEANIQPCKKKSLELLEASSIQQHSGAQFYLAQLYRSGDQEIDLAPNARLFWQYLLQAQESGNPDAYYCLGDIYFHGLEGEEINLQKAYAHYSKAAEQNHSDALCCLGVMRYNGLGVAKDYHLALKFYQQAADLHNNIAWRNLSSMYLLGHGVPKCERTAAFMLSMVKQNDARNES